jgi:hypothetical protein
MQMGENPVMSAPPDFPLWRRALALLLTITGVLLVYAAPIAETVGRSWAFPVGIVGGLVCFVLGCALVARRIVCDRCGRSIVNVGGRPRDCPIRSCLRCGAPLFPEGAALPKRRKWSLWVLGALLLLYVGSYAALSRRGYAEADQYNMNGGFYYFSPDSSEAWRWKNYGCAHLFWPINAVDRWLGLGRHPACEPLWGLSK